MNAAPLARILIVDDESAHLRALCDSLRDQGYETTGFTGGEDALAALREKPFDVLLTDLMMPGMDGVALLAAALKIDPQLAGILMTGVGTIRTAVQAMQAGAMDYVLKPFKVSSLLPTLARALSLRRLRIENLELRDTVAIHELNQAIAHTLDPNVLLDRIADAVLAQFEADEASVMLLDDDGRSLRVAAVRGEGRESLLGARVAVGQGIAGWVAAHREPLVLQGEVLDPRVEPLRRRPEIRSALSMPMVARGKLIGVLNVNYIRRPRAFAIGQTRVLAIFTNAAAVGIEAARLHDGQRKADLRYREVLDMAADGIISLDSERRVVVFNRGAERIFGYRAAEVIGGPLEMFLPAEALEARLDAPGSLGAGPGADRPAPSHRRLFGRRKDGTPVNVEMAISERSESGMTLYTAVVRDITQRVQQEERIARLTRLYTVLSGVNSAIVRIADESGLFAEICRVGTQAGGFMAACVGMPDRDRGEMKIAAAAGVALEATGATAATSVAVELAERAIREQAVVWDNDLAARNSVGSPREDAPVPRAHAAAALPFVLGEAVHAVMMLYADAPGAFGDEEVRLLRDLAGDVSFALDHIAKTRQVDYLATHDQLTGLPNRTLFVERLAQALATAKRDAQPLAVVLADIERFKRVNDTFGRQAGDALLREVAERLRALVEDGASLARVGPDVFATIWGRFAQPAGLARIVRERGDRAMDASFEADGQALRLALRFGVAFFPGDGADTEALFRNAEAALRRAKARHERLAFYTPELNARVAQQLSLESKLRRALERDEFVLHFQPKVDLGTGGIAGFEALVRWRDAESGRLVLPAHFITLLEETGLNVRTGRWVMREAVRTAAALRAKGLPPLRIAVNVSPMQLREKDFVRSVEEAIASGGGTPHGLDLEITESVIMHDIEENVRKLKELHEMGVEAAIDDFGTGYSSLAYVARLPVGLIKIDRAFVRNLKEDPDSVSIVQTIVSLTHSLERKVVAEGVETAEQARLLRLLRCDQCQGYFFGKPVPAAGIEPLLLSPPER